MDYFHPVEEYAAGDGRIDRRVLATIERVLSGGSIPAVTLSWAQTLNGVIAEQRTASSAISSPDSLVFTHRLRSIHRGILVGIGTVLADDPLLSVRLVDGPQPRPIVLDSSLRTPPGSRLLGRTDMAPWIFHSESVPDREKALTERGARLFRVAGGKGGLEPHEIFHALGREGVTSVMVEGGASVLSSLLSLGMWHQVVITVSPRMMTGVQLFIGKEASDARISFEDAIWERHGRDIAVWGVPPPVPGIKLGNRVTN